jgi:hypothetical protein
MYFCWLVYRGRIQAESIKPDGLAAGSREHLTTTSSFLSPILPCLPLYVSVVSICLSASVCLSLSPILPPASLYMYLSIVSVSLSPSVCPCHQSFPASLSMSLSVVSVCLPPSVCLCLFVSVITLTISYFCWTVCLCLLITTVPITPSSSVGICLIICL